MKERTKEVFKEKQKHKKKQKQPPKKWKSETGPNVYNQKHKEQRQ